MKVYNDDENPIVAKQTQDVSSGDRGSSSRTDRIKVNIINKLEAPLEETKFKVMLELIGNESGNNRPGLDLVTVLDCSMSMKGEKLEKMKLAMQLVIKKLSPIDRLSVVKFCGHSERLCPLRPMTENSKAEIEKLVNFWQKWMYYCVPVQHVNRDINETRLSVQEEDFSQSNCGNTWYRGIWQQIASCLLAVLGINRIYEMKLVHRQSPRLLRCICEQIKEDLDNNEINGIINALHEAAARGVVEFVVEVLKKFPEFRWLRDKEGSTIFMKAVQFRQADVFCLIHEFPSEDKMVVLVDKRGENILHKLQYSSVDKISTIQGGLIKMQKELKWFEEIKSMMPPDSLKMQNHEQKTAQQLFDKSHEELMMYAENGMTKTSESCIVVSILVVTIMFAAVFTFPGGNNQDTGLPLFLNINLFKTFIISVAVSLCFSTASVLMFLGILTSRYAKKDFLEPLPRKMIIALLTLFISITAMMVAFTVTLFIMLRSELRISLPIIVSLASFPVILSAIFMFPLLSEYIMSTYGPSIFKRKSKLLLSG